MPRRRGSVGVRGRAGHRQTPVGGRARSRRTGGRRFLLWAIVLTLGGVAPRTVAVAAAAPSTPGPTTLERFVVVPGESQAVYRAGEVFFSQQNRFNVAVGTTNAIQGELWIDRTDPRRSRIGTMTVDISTLKSDQERRDSAIRNWWLESSRFPTAQFTPTAIRGLPEAYARGQEVFVQIEGRLRIRQVTRPVTFAARLLLDGNTLSGTATTTILMTDFGFDPPSILGILKAENQVNLELHLTARTAG